jgi:hypothetical protein
LLSGEEGRSKSLKNRALFDFFSRYKIYLLLFLGLIVGLIYVFLVPPWMHYDEPGHFEYAWLAANQEIWPVEVDYDQYMRREVAASMLEHRFNEYLDVSIEITSIYKPVLQLLAAQVGDQPLYYFLVSLPLRLVKYTDITFQLYIGRLVSLMMFLVTVWISWQVASLLFGREHPMSWLVPLSLIAIPSFVDLMTAVNNDTLAILGFSAFVWASVLMLQRGFSPLRFAFLFFTVLVCYFAKSTAWLAIPMSLLVLPLSIVRGPRQKFVWVGLALVLVASMALGIDRSQSVPAYFVTTGQQHPPLRVTDSRAPSGNFVLKNSAQIFYQMITREGQKQITGKPVTFSAWIWADQDTDIKFPEIGRLDMTKVVLSDQKLHVTTEPTLYSASIDIPEGEYIAWLSFFGNASTAVYWDDISLIAAEPSDATKPVAQSGMNIVRNGSIEAGHPKLTNLVDQILAKVDVNMSTLQIIQLFDYDSVWWYLRTTAIRVFKTFCVNFGWGNVPLVGKFADETLLVLIVLSSLTSLLFMVKKIKTLPKTMIFLFLVIITLQLFFVFARGAGSWYSLPYYPTARYLYPVILPLVMFFVYGISQLLNMFRLKLNPNNIQTSTIWSAVNMIHLFCSVMLIVWGIVSIYSFYV